MLMRTPTPSTTNRFFCTFGRKSRFVRRFEKLTLFPKVLALPQTSHLPDMGNLPSSVCLSRNGCSPEEDARAQVFYHRCGSVPALDSVAERESGAVSGRRHLQAMSVAYSDRRCHLTALPPRKTGLSPCICSGWMHCPRRWGSLLLNESHAYHTLHSHGDDGVGNRIPRFAAGRRCPFHARP